MSTILDALKKSEQERKLANLPELSSMPLPEEEHDASRLWWGMAILALLVIAIIAYLILNSPEKNAQLSPSSTSQQSYQTAQSVSNVERSYVVDSKIYSYSELSGKIREVADKLKVNVVSYTEDEAKRFIMIDSNLYRMGNVVSLPNGAKVEIRDIESNSVVLRYKDTQFRLSP